MDEQDNRELELLEQERKPNRIKLVVLSFVGLGLLYLVVTIVKEFFY